MWPVADKSPLELISPNAVKVPVANIFPLALMLPDAVMWPLEPLTSILPCTVSFSTGWVVPIPTL